MPDRSDTDRTDVTALLHEWRRGDADAMERMIEAVYDELRSIASRHLRRERPDHTLDTSALVHEAYVSLVDQSAVDWQDRAHFFAIASRTMRRVLVWHARKRSAAKRGGGVRPVTHDAARHPDPDAAEPVDLLDLNAALERLDAMDPRLCRVVECRYFGGLTVEETGHALDISPATVKRDWRSARAWLRVELAESTG